jgi:hypothetical protein
MEFGFDRAESEGQMDIVCTELHSWSTKPVKSSQSQIYSITLWEHRKVHCYDNRSFTRPAGHYTDASTVNPWLYSSEGLLNMHVCHKHTSVSGSIR